MMSEIFTTEVQYILNDSELIFDHPQDSGSLGDITYPDGSRAILVNGHILQEDKDTYILKEEDLGQIFVTDSQSASDQETEFIQYVDECSNNDIDENQIFYIENKELSDLQLSETSHSFENNDLIFGEEFIDVADLIKLEGGESEIVYPQTGIQYAIIKEGEFHLQAIEQEQIPVITTKNNSEIKFEHPVPSSAENTTKIVDLSVISGRNILTGQKVRLDSFLGKIKDNTKCNEKNKLIIDNVNRQKVLLNSLLHKKLKLGKTSNGKQLVGKIVQIRHKKEETDDGTDRKMDNKVLNNDSTNQELHKKVSVVSSHPKIRTNKVISKMVSNESFSHISRTLEGLMTMESVRNKMDSKKIFVKLVEKQWLQRTEIYQRKISYVSGYMRCNQKEGKVTWTFVRDNNFTEQLKETNGTETTLVNDKQSDSVTLTMIIAHEKNGKRHLKVILNQHEGIKCLVCHKKFESNLQLRTHVNIKHERWLENYAQSTPFPKIKGAGNDEIDLKLGIEKGNKISTRKAGSNQFKCSICGKRFSTDVFLQEHSSTHMNDEYVCDKKIDEDKFQKRSDSVPSKKGLMKSRYVCKICKRIFSRQSNLLRHVGIHKGMGKMYECDICGCSYHFISSLTRHVVQNHLQH